MNMQRDQSLVKIAAGWLLALMIAVAAAILSIVWVNNTVMAPGATVSRYLEALKAGHGGEALGMLRATVPDSNAAMLDGTALQTAASALSDIDIEQPHTVSDNRVSVSVNYSINGTHRSSKFLLEQTGTVWLFFKTWSFVPMTLPTLKVTAVNSSESVLNGVPVNLPRGSGTFAVFYPGKYVGSLNGSLFNASPVESTVTAPENPQTMQLLTSATPKLKADVNQKIKEYLDNCAATATKNQQLQPACPFYHATKNLTVDGTIDWKIIEYPQASIEPFNGQWVISQLSGKAKVTAWERDYFTGNLIRLDVEHDFSLGARLDITDEKISITPVLYY